MSIDDRIAEATVPEVKAWLVRVKELRQEGDKRNRFEVRCCGELVLFDDNGPGSCAKGCGFSVSDQDILVAHRLESIHGNLKCVERIAV